MNEIKSFLLLLKRNTIDITLVGDNLKVSYDDEEKMRLFSSRIRENKDSILKFLKESSYYSIPTSPILDSYPLSSSQRRLLLLSNFSGASGAYNIPAVLRFSGSLDINFLKESYFSMLSRHEILRTVFRETIDGMGCQIVLPDAHSDSFTHLFLDFVSEKGVIEEIIFQETGRIFELSSGPLIRLTLVEDRSGGGYIFCLVMHHIISDGWSMDILQRELFTLYNNFKSGSSAVLPPLGLQYKDYAFWEQSNNEHLDSTSRDYWRAQFSGELPVLALPSKGARPAVKTYNSSHVSGFVSLDTLSLLKEVSLTSGSTLFMTVLSAVKVLLYRYSGQKDLIIGTPVAGREHADLEDQIGFYVNTLALRSCIDGEDRFMDFLSSVRETTLQGYSHQSYPFDRLVEDLDIVRDLSRHPVFDVMVSFQESVSGVSESNSVFSDGLIVEPYNTSGYAVSKFDLDFSFSENASGLSIGLGYNTDIYDLSFVERLLNSLEILLVSISCTPEMNINKLDILGAEDHYLLTQGFNQTAAVYPKDKSVIDLFESQVLLTPENTALIFEGTEFSYGELNERSNQFAHYLRSQYNIGREDLVGVELERSDSLIIALLGILKSGGAYVPIDPSYPSERIAYMLSDSGCKVNINAEEYLLFNMERDLYSCESIGEYPSSCDLAYVIYTSGSTGQPKGVMVEHGSLANLLLDVSSLFPFGGSLSGSFPLLASPAFDISLFELFYPLLQGLGVMVLGQDKIKDVDYLRAHLGEMNSLHTVPALMSELLSQIKSSGSAENYSHIEYIFIGGDKVPTPVLHDIRSVFRDAKIVTLYGPTECTIFLLTRSYTNSVDEFNGSLLGCPISNTQVYILSEGESLCPVGVVGEICISGAGLARGYLNKESLTNEKFVINPYSGENMYKTGDLGRWDSEGNIEFLGRKDNQVKIRGYRIELGEIESTLQGHEGVTGSVVLAVENEEGQKELAAYITGTGTLSGSELRDYLRGSLPDYMIPGHYLQLDSFPLTSNGKLDRSNLPDVFGVSLGSGVEYVAARNETEEKLISIWENVLGKSGIGIKDNFFELGGHSLKAARLSALIHKEFNVKISLQDIFTEFTIEKQGLLLGVSDSDKYISISKAPDLEHYPLSSSQHRLWILSRFEGANKAYNMPEVFRISGDLDMNALQQAYFTLLSRHEILRTVFYESADGEAYQRILSSNQTDSFQHHIIDFESDNILQSIISQEVNHIFDLSEGPLIRLTIVENSSDSKYVFCLVMHHIISDGWSMEVLRKELFSFYSNFTKKQNSEFPSLRLQYKDYAFWEQSGLENRSLISKTYWQEQLSGDLPVLNLPSKGIRPSIKTYNGEYVYGNVSNEVLSGLKEISLSTGSSFFMIVLSAVKVLLYRYSGQKDLIIGTPVAGREHAELQDQIGFYVNTLALRSHIKGDERFIDFLSEVRKMTLSGYTHQSYPFDRLIEDLDIVRDMSRNPVFDVMVNLQDSEEKNISDDFSEKIFVNSYNGMSYNVSKFDLDFSFVENSSGLSVGLCYNTDIYDRSLAEQLMKSLELLLISINESSETIIDELNILPQEEHYLLTEGFNQTKAAYPQDKTVIDLFESQVLLTPDNTALIFEGTELSYRELDERSNQFAHYLRGEYNIGREDLVGVQLERSSDFVITILGILKSGGAYVPIDPSYPSDRIAYMKEDSGCKLVVDIEELLLFKMEMDDYSVLPVEHRSQPDDLVYVIYTSGSTGRPKGVMIENKSLMNYLFWGMDYYPHGDFSIFTSASFDLTYTGIFLPLITGYSVTIEGNNLIGIEEDQRLNFDSIKITPSHFEVLGENLRSNTVILGGEKLVFDQVNNFFDNNKNAHIYNEYGPTEATIGCTIYHLDSSHDFCSIVPIGRPISNTQIYILSEGGSLCPVGVVGELYISGSGLSRGYLNRPDLTLEKFLPNPYLSGERMYKTGDLGRWLWDGNIEYIGRKDNQVKIRGYRIELGEIESTLKDYEGVSGSIVLAVENGEGQKELAAYITGTRALSGSELRDYLRDILPDYMVPGHYIQLDSFPLTSNGKLDWGSLPDAFGVSLGSGVEYVAARNEVEEKLVSIWENVLGKSGIGIQDNFFELGGHSLKAARLSALIHQEFNVKISLQDIFSESTIEKQGLLLGVSNSDEYISISPAPFLEGYPLSSSQRRLWILSRFEGADGAYNIPEVFRVSGKVDVTSLKDSYFTLLSRHEILRTVFRENVEGEVFQYILTDVFEESFAHLILDFSKEEDIVSSMISSETSRIFDLSEGPLIRFTVLEDASGSGYIFCLVMHHIISDGWSMGILKKELFTLYHSFEEGHSAVLRPLTLQYKDYAFWEQSGLETNGLVSKAYWQEQLSGDLPVLDLPSKGIRPTVKTYRGENIYGFISEPTLSELKRISLNTGCTLFMTVLSAVKVLLYRYSGQSDLIIGTPVAGRDHADLHDQIGFYVNTLALRSHVDGGCRFVDYLLKVRDMTLSGYAYQSYPFDRLVDDLDTVRDMSRNPVFDVMLNFQDLESGNIDNSGDLSKGISSHSYEEFSYAVSKFDLDFSFSDNGSGFTIGLCYNTDLYDRIFADRLMNSLELLLKSISESSETIIDELDILPQEEHYLLTEGFNQTKAAYPQDKTVIDLFESQVLLRPDNTALIFEGTELSYRELDERSNQFAHYLRSQYNIGRDDLVGIQLERSSDLLITILGILKSGGAYVPIDPSYPSDRIAYMKEDSGCRVVVNSEELLLFHLEMSDYSVLPVDHIIHPNDLAYVIYTSGSTGRPKGVMVEHGGLVNRLVWMQGAYGLSPSDTLIQKTNYSFDVSVWELLWWSLYGSKLSILSPRAEKSADLLLSAIASNEVSVIHFVPSMLESFLDYLSTHPESLYKLHSLKQVFVSGEALTAYQNREFFRLLPDVKLMNLYGPTEATIDVSYFECHADLEGSIPIGSPISNTRMYILSAGGSLCPLGVVGEICISGAGLARGYLNNELLTKEKFVSNRYVPGERLYKTGDLGRWLSDGSIEYIGRKDNQVKIRGYRIELGEIELALQGHADVSGSVVVAVENNDGHKELAAYITGSTDLSIVSLRDYLRGLLPDYMIPGHYIQLDSFPLTSNGKLDRKSLPDAFLSSLGSGSEYVAARNETESLLVEIWEDVLGASNIGVLDNFFELGGHSLKAARLSTLIHQKLDVKISLQDVFTEPTIEKQSLLIEAHSIKNNIVEDGYDDREVFIF